MNAEPGNNTVSVEQVPTAATYPLWRDVLRDGRPVDRPASPAGTIDLAARGPDGRIVGVVRFVPSVCPWRREATAAWQLRGMATAPAVRMRGIGRALVEDGIAQLTAQGGGLIWCDARTSAVGFYERMGFQVVTEEFDKPDTGPHVGMMRLL